VDLQWLRTPEPERLFSLTDRPGHLRLYGRQSIGSWFEFSVVARRQEDFSFRAETVIDFDPQTYQEVAGLTHYYNRYKFHALAVTWHETLGRCLTIQSCPGDYPSGNMQFPTGSGISLPDGRIHLAAEVDANDLQFFWHAEGESDWKAFGPMLDGGVISDEGGRGEHGSFTGAFVGVFAYDITGQGQIADFDAFSYERK
jgi:xylan 1,4-beta-xylosidase